MLRRNYLSKDNASEQSKRKYRSKHFFDSLRKKIFEKFAQDFLHPIILRDTSELFNRKQNT